MSPEGSARDGRYRAFQIMNTGVHGDGQDTVDDSAERNASRAGPSVARRSAMVKLAAEAFVCAALSTLARLSVCSGEGSNPFCVT